MRGRKGAKPELELNPVPWVCNTRSLRGGRVESVPSDAGSLRDPPIARLMLSSEETEEADRVYPFKRLSGQDHPIAKHPKQKCDTP
ncbi:hypothetical protein PGTUg99_023566 [Puccinia graminis f. sp. tritici]|uniref:Uncharacterized protein n=1 Tax=Puccinia graminis f. sp. tritici TaxID=56615 RepID=A0A5B0R8L0_PUCGR|nr:hypothetical protein PGTUg99_023566 [Puccinia graminis f. sp. tritici]